MKRGLIAVFVAAALGVPSLVHGDWTAEAPRKLAGDSGVEETVWRSARPPGGVWDKVAVHRYLGPGPATAALVYLPGTNMNGSAALTDEDHNLWVFLATRGVEVWALDYRTRAVPPDAAREELAALRGWTMEAFVEDARAAAALARRESGRAKLFVAGFSRGVWLSYALACREPDTVAGLVLLDGAFKNHAPKAAFDYPAALGKLEASGAWANDVAGRLGWDARQKLMDTVAASPGAPATDPKFETLGDQLASLLQLAWRPGGLANPQGGMSQPRVLARLLAGYDRYYPAIQDVEGRGIGDHDDDPRTPIDDRWGELALPILNVTGTGMGGDWVLNSIYSADKSGSPDVTLVVLERYGHLDVIVGEKARREVYEPALEWIRARSGKP